jgi:outer membrane protein assembly factor BamB
MTYRERLTNWVTRYPRFIVHSPRNLLTAIATVALLSSIAVATIPTEGDASTSVTLTSWTVYHGNVAGTGVVSSLASVDTSKPRWTSPSLVGQLYGEPLVEGTSVYVATEDDYVYALDATNGRVRWVRHIANAVPSSDLPCGDITPSVGVTGTPVIDAARNEIFVVADELINGGPHHFLVGLNLSSGAIEMRYDVDPAGSVPAALLARTGLTLDANRVIFGMGGNYGDCASYRGRVISVSVTGANQATFTVDDKPGQSQGAIWMGGAAPVVDATGNVWVSVGNGSVYSATQGYDDSDSVLELSPSMRLQQYFAPSDWPTNNREDLDMSTAPVLLGSSRVLLAGKSGIAYLLNQRDLGGIGHQETTAQVCNGNIDGGSVIEGSTVYLPCVGGIVAVRVATSANLTVAWRTTTSSGPALYGAGLLWTIGQDGVLYGLSPANGAVRQRVHVGTEVNHFPTPAFGDGLFLVPTQNNVVAFATAP